MGMAIDSIRAGMDEENSHCREESSRNNSSGPAAGTVNVNLLAHAIAGGGIFDSPGGGKGAVSATAVDLAVGSSTEALFRNGGGDGGIANDSGGLQESVNPLEEDRKMRRRQVERTAARLRRVRTKDGNGFVKNLSAPSRHTVSRS